MASHPILAWVADTELAHLASHTRWVFAAAQSVHFMGLSLLLGSVTVLDLRILGWLRQIRIERLLSLIPLALGGFAIQALTGFVMFSAEPSRYWKNPGFRIKMALLVVAGLNALWFWLLEHRKLAALGGNDSAGLSARLVAATSIAIWIAVITFGRFIPYLDGIDLAWVPGG